MKFTNEDLQIIATIKEKSEQLMDALQHIPYEMAVELFSEESIEVIGDIRSIAEDVEEGEYC
ncbi:hypothetical protein ACMXYR_02805 [Neptuniibacter sp. QD29_5]|uniref:hypothetical protein n=1 Tax=Neptuniibacter sp. QD29_5 TaxID=3398207 RepID=UPI0039F6357C